MWLLANTTTKLRFLLQKKHEQAVKLTDAEIWRKPLNYHFAAPKIKGLKYYSYIYTSPSAAAMQNRHFLGHNQSPSHQKQLAWLLIITSRRKVLVLGLCDQKHPENVHLATGGRVRTGHPLRAGVT